jgi:trimeric autotransporter adhesin
MAYQSKNNKKFLASTMTAAVVASAVAPGVSFAAENEFPDVPTNHNYYEVITALSEAGVIKGMPDGSFDLGGKVTRAQASQMVAKILELDTNVENTPFADVKLGVWYTDSINALYAEGHIKGLDEDTFAPNKEMTRAEFAQLIVEAYDIPAKDENLPFTDLKEGAWYESAIKTLYAHGLIKGQSATEFGPNDTIKRGDFAWLLANTDYQFGDTLEKAAPAVESVNAVNAKTIEVKFTKAVDAETLKNAASVDVITVVAGEGALDAGEVTQKLSEDGKTLTLKAADIFKGDYTVKVPFEVVKDVDGEFVSPVNAKVTVNDTAAPVLASASSTIKDTEDGIKNIALTFDEDVESIETVKIDGTNYDAVVDGNKATVAVNLDAEKSYDVTVVNATDAAGNVKAVQSASLDVAVDDRAPSIVDVEAIGENQVKVTVDEELNADTLNITANVGTFTTDIVENIEVNEDNKKEYVVTLDSDYLFKNGNSDTINLVVAKDALADAVGNTNAEEITNTVVVSKDATAPAAVEVATSKTDGKVASFSVTYNEEVANVDDTKVSVVNSKGEILSVDQVVENITIDGKEVEFALVASLVADEYSFELAEGFATDNALTPNESAKYEFSVNVTEDEAPVETSFEIDGAEAVDNVITVDFGEKVKATGTGSALDPSAYQINGVTLPADTEIAFKEEAGVLNQAKVEITLPAGFVKSDDAKAIFTATGIETLDNKESLPFTKTVSITDNTAPVANTFVATDIDEITVTYSEAINIADLATISDEITLLDNEGAEIEFSSYEVTEEGELVLTVVDSSLVSTLVTNEVEDVDADIVDEAGNGQKAGLTVSK